MIYPHVDLRGCPVNLLQYLLHHSKPKNHQLSFNLKCHHGNVTLPTAPIHFCLSLSHWPQDHQQWMYSTLWLSTRPRSLLTFAAQVSSKEKLICIDSHLNINSVQNFSTSCFNAWIIQYFPKENGQKVQNFKNYLLKTKGFQILYATLNFWSDDGRLQKLNISTSFFIMSAIL